MCLLQILIQYTHTPQLRVLAKHDNTLYIRTDSVYKMDPREAIADVNA